jgi:hypothetical protein
MRTARLALLAVLAVGCNAPSTGPAGYDTTGPFAHAPTGTGSAGGICYLVSNSEIGSIMGKQPLTDGVGFEIGGLRECSWSLSLSPVESAGIQLGDVSTFDPLGDPVGGLGEAAYWLGEGADELSVKSGQYSLIVLAQSSTVDPKTAAIAIARLALSRLP